MSQDMQEQAKATLDAVCWKAAAGAVVDLYTQGKPFAYATHKAAAAAVIENMDSVWYAPLGNTAWVYLNATNVVDVADKVAEEFSACGLDEIIVQFAADDTLSSPNAVCIWRPLRRGADKVAYSKSLLGLRQLSLSAPSKISKALHIAPSPLASTIAGGAIGAGLGYAGGTVAEWMYPEEWEKGKLRRTLAMAGGAIGAAPGVGAGIMNKYMGRGWNDPSLLNQAPKANETSQGSSSREALRDLYRERLGLPPHTSSDKQASYFGHNVIPVKQTLHTLLYDPEVAGRLPAPLQATAAGLVHGASMSRGGSAVVSPMDIARVAVGMGSGYVSGAFVGKALGVLAGAPPGVQSKLRQTGMYAGVLLNVVPMLSRR